MALTGPSSISERWNNRALLRLLWPLILEQLLSVAMGAADTIMVSPLGEFAISGVNLIDNINQLFIIAFMSLATGGAVVVSQYIGRKDYANADIAARQLVYMVTLVSLAITLIALIFRAPVIQLVYGVLDENVFSAAMVYFLITALSYPMLGLYNACSALFRASGNSKIPMLTSLLTNILHIGINAFFLFVLRMGVLGVALSTLVSRLAAAVILLVILVFSKKYPISLAGLFRITLVPAMIRKILNIGIPAGLESSFFQLGKLLTNRIPALFGTSIIAANASASLINSLSFMPGNAFLLALLTVAGQCIGAGDYDAAKHYTKKILFLNWITVFALCVFIFFSKDLLLGPFNLSEDGHAAARVYLDIHNIVMIVCWIFGYCLPSSLRAAGDAKFIMFTGAASMWLVRVCGSYFIAFILGWGPVGVWIAMGLDGLARSICFYLRWKHGKWQKIKVIDG